MKLRYIIAGLGMAIFIRDLLKKGLESYKAFRLRKSRRKPLPELPKIPASKQAYILSLNASQLVKAIKSSKVTSLEATSVYIARAYSIGRDLELTAEEPFVQALELASQRDLQLQNSPETCGKLHGLPISLKDQLPQIGCHSGCGLIHKAEIPDTKNAEIVDTLLREGAVPFIRSNVPQYLMWIECVSRIYGRSKNPWNKDHSTGGSSGGEAGLVAARCSVLGFGSDIGGSIRIPSVFCGVYGFKPTPSRVSRKNIRTSCPENVEALGLFIPSACGPIARCVGDLRLSLEVLFETDDYFSDSIPFQKVRLNDKKLKIGFYTDIYYYESMPAVRRAVLESKAALEAEGHTVVEFDPPGFMEAIKLYNKAYTAFGADPIERGLQGEEPMSFYKPSIFFWNFPSIKNFWLEVMKNNGNKRIFDYMVDQGLRNNSGIRDVHYEIMDYTDKLVDYWKKNELDAVISPAIGIVANKHDLSMKAFPSVAYGFLWNFSRFPVGVLPITQVKPGETEYKSDYQDLLSEGGKILCKDTVGLPVGIQVVGEPFRDEKVLEVMKILETKFSFHKLAL